MDLTFSSLSIYCDTDVHDCDDVHYNGNIHSICLMCCVTFN